MAKAKLKKTKSEHQHFRLTKRKKTKKTKLISSWQLLANSLKRIKSHWKVVLGLVIIHGLLQVVFAFDLTLTETQTLYSSLFLVVFSLSYIWVFREQQQKKPKVSISNAIYHGPGQLVPFVLLILLATIQAIPFSFGGWIYGLALGGNIAIFYWEKLLFALLWLLLTIPTAYWLTTTLLSLIVVAIPGVRPLEAYRATKLLVRPYFSNVLWRMGGFVIFVGAVIVGLFWLLVWREYLTLALRVPVVVNIFILPLFWAYLFSLYTELRKA